MAQFYWPLTSDIPITEDAFFQQLFNQLQPTDVLATFLWLSKGIDFNDEDIRPYGMPPEINKFIIGVLMEATGDLNGALEQYKYLIPELPTGSVLKEPLDAAIRRVSAKLVPPQGQAVGGGS